MKKFFAFAAFALLVTACSQQPEYKITGTVSDTNLNGNYVYLYPYGPDAVPTDSILVENGSFAFSGVQDVPQLYTIRFAEGVVEKQRVGTGEVAPYTALLTLDNSKLSVELSETPSVKGNPENDAYYALQTALKQLRADSKQIFEDARSENKEIVAAAEKRYEEMEEATNAKIKEFLYTHADKQIAAKLFSDFRYSLEENERREIVAKASEAFKSVPGIDKMIEHLEILEKVAIGKKFTDFEMAGLDGKMHKLSEYVGNGKVVLIDFWASWCPPCRADMPHLVGLYKEYKGKDFEIVGISLDRAEDAWKKGLEDLHMTWPQLSDLQYWKNAGAALYGVNSIPHTVLVDKDGTIVAKSLRGEKLEAKLAELLK
ncbi:DUF4369 domain-containing protein [Parabacteroides sp. 52]|uniref:TlpA disulfide reductase family protein n=1 Tax=Parabacteroides sp. 52 TaxID=2302940 RepID=UPI0013D2A2A8|nr:TlpA disulfide reductase family protein [Parabacteroides sp. 52]NDV54375.1 DUF4369 domain-containing protein [Parabacteroides sp. 52]